MRQILQNLRTGSTEVTDVPAPGVARRHVLIRTNRTLVSAGTERMLVQFGQAGWIEKARQQPDKVRAVLSKMRTDGLAPTIEAVFNKLDQPLPLGYCNVGVAIETGAGVSGIAVGDRIASNGRHAEIVSVPMNLCARVPENVSDDEAAFTVIGAIGLQGIRLAQPSIGEYVVVTGLGLIGLLTVQMLHAQGCHVLGIDLDPDKLALAESYGARVVNVGAGEDPVAAAVEFSRGRGVDAAIITASTASSEPIHQAAAMSRKRGRIVLVGVSGLSLSRADFYEKELTFQVSCSYGPGRYDANYEAGGVDYPIGFVRWTEQRNFEAVLGMMAARRIDVTSLISHRFSIADAGDAYAVVTGQNASLGILLDYPRPEAAIEDDQLIRTVSVRPAETASDQADQPGIGFLGAGNYATAMLIPAFKKAGARLRSVSSAGGVSGLHAARKFGFELTTTDTTSVLCDPHVEALVVATRHNSHADLVCRALDAGKHVFVEKPLAIQLNDVERIATALQAQAATNPRLLMVGFNRRFAPQVRRIKTLLNGVTGPRAVLVTVNAGALPIEHWTQDPEVGGGRIVGEACHFIDLLRFLVGSPITDYQAVGTRPAPGGPPARENVTITLSFEDGSIGTILYLANGHKSFPKERLEIFSGGRILALDNFRRLRGYGWPKFSRMNLRRQDKGQRACAAAFVDAVRTGGVPPIPIDEILEVSRISIELAEALR